MKYPLFIPFSIFFVVAVLELSTGCDRERERIGIDFVGQAYGSEQDIEFANRLWTAIQGYEEWPLKTDYYQGTEPHGAVLRMYYNIVNVNDDNYHVIVKDNFMGDQITIETVEADPSEYFDSATIMVQREEGYDPENNNWYWVKYDPDGTLDMDPEGVAMAGRVSGCIDCHSLAQGSDYFFSNDPNN